MELVASGDRSLNGILTINPMAGSLNIHESKTPPWPDLLARVQSGDSSAQEELVEALSPQVARCVFKLCPRRDSVEDLSQDAAKSGPVPIASISFLAPSNWWIPLSSYCR